MFNAKYIMNYTEKCTTKYIEKYTAKYNRGSIVANRYELCKQLGKGSCATVWEAYDNDDEVYIAIKLAKGELECNQIEDEVYILTQLCGVPGVCQMFNSLTSGNIMYGFTMELYKHTIGECVCTEDIIIDVAKQLLLILSNIHKRGYVHTDIKPPNIVWNGGHQVVLCDFDWAYPISLVKTFDRITTTPWYRAPEMIKMVLTGIRSVYRTGKLDIWALGVTLAELIMYQNENEERINIFDMDSDGNELEYDREDSDASHHLEMIDALDLSKFIPNECMRDLISQMLTIDPNIRPTSDELLQHAIFTS